MTQSIAATPKPSRFTNKQITAMVLALSAAVLFTPATVYAATSSNVKITDKYYSSRVARVSSSGNLMATVAGTVNSRMSTPASAFHRYGFYIAGDTVLATVAKGKDVAMSSLAATAKGNGTESRVEWRKAKNGSCVGATEVIGIVAAYDARNDGSASGGPNVNWTHSLPVPHVRKATDTALCLALHAGANQHLTVDGFYF